MKSQLIYTACLISALFSVGNVRSQGGGFGHFAAGISMAPYSKVSRDLSSTALMGDITISNRGIYLGGGGYGLIGHHLLLGGKGFAASQGKVSNARGSVSMGQAYGFFNFGYMADPWAGFFPYIFGGVGGGGASMTIENLSGSSMDFGGISVSPNDQINLSVGGTAFELGAGLHHFIGSKHGGFKLGLELGYSFAPLNNQWGNENAQAANLNKYTPGTAYLTVTIGGGKVSLD